MIAAGTLPKDELGTHDGGGGQLPMSDVAGSTHGMGFMGGSLAHWLDDTSAVSSNGARIGQRNVE